MFRGLIDNSMEIYVDDLLVKSKEEVDHLIDLAEAFHILRRYRMKLNPAKYAFNVSSGKILGHMISKRVEANPEKIQAIINIWSP